MGRALLLVLLTGCLTNPGLRDERLSELECENGADLPQVFRDEDGDGFGDPDTAARACAVSGPGWVDDDTDCNDADDRVFPGADERCSGRDDNCDGRVDVDAIDATTWYPDEDGDGFGTTVGAEDACDGPPGTGFVGTPGDCDDTAWTVFPGAEETCDGVDEDCDGQVDQPAPPGSPVYFPDADGDGFGDPTLPTPACTLPPGYVTDSNDCDDTDPGVYPGSTDSPLQDRDCDGLNGGTAVANVELHGTPNQYLGHSVSAAGDLDGDGLPDFVAGAPGNDPLVDPGTAWIVLGADVAGYAAMASTGLAHPGEAYGDLAASAVGGGGDMDGDGFSDVVVGSPGHMTGRGSAYVVFGETAPAATSLELAAEFRGDQSGDACGSAVSLSGDVSGDGFADLLVGAPDDGLTGSIYVVYGSANARAGGFLLTDGDTLTGASDSEAGTSVAHLGDFDGDGIGDVAVGGPGLRDGANQTGGVWLLDGGTVTSGTLDGLAAHVFLGELPGDLAGASVAGAGDIDGDGREDMLIGAPGHDGLAGAAYLVRGTPGGAGIQLLANAAATRLVGGPAELAGWSVSPAGDVDADGHPDWVVGAPSAGSNSEGAVYLQRGDPVLPAALDTTTVTVAIPGELATDAAGASLAGIGDIDGDGFDDLAIGASTHDHAGTDTGSIYLIFGQPL